VQLDFLLVRIGRFALECEEERLLPNTHPSRDLHHPALLRLELQLVPDFYGGVRSHRLQRHPPRGLQNDTLLRARQGLSCRLLHFRFCLDCDETGIFALLGGEKVKARITCFANNASVSVTFKTLQEFYPSFGTIPSTTSS
jgi:hypothetical protein